VAHNRSRGPLAAGPLTGGVAAITPPVSRGIQEAAVSPRPLPFRLTMPFDHVDEVTPGGAGDRPIPPQRDHLASDRALGIVGIQPGDVALDEHLGDAREGVLALAIFREQSLPRLLLGVNATLEVPAPTPATRRA
jgi:hypothetical protein